MPLAAEIRVASGILRVAGAVAHHAFCVPGTGWHTGQK
jgi:hypothetical protein